MPARALGTATVSFGLVSIPIKLYSATSPTSAISFNLLHKKCSGRLKQQYICPQDNNQVVERDDMVKGYEFSKDRYVTFTPDELKALEEKATQTIEITEFVPLAAVDPMYFDKTYYLGPDKGGDKAYRLLAEVMERTQRAALARYAARGKQYLVLLRPKQGALVMQQLLYADEVKPFSEVPIPEAPAVKEPELKLAIQLVEQISSDQFRPEAYEDDVRKRIQELIQRKVEGQEISLAPAEAPKAQIIDIMEALKASLQRKTGEVAPAAEEAAEDERKPARKSPRAAAGETKAKAAKK
jgi:DNA end-binding protein Ku